MNNRQITPEYTTIIIARKPCEGSCIDNVLKYGVGGINIEECRIGDDIRTYKGAGASPSKISNHSHGDTGIGMLDGSGNDLEFTVAGRFPSNVILSYNDETEDEVCCGMPNTSSNGGATTMPDFKDAGQKNSYNKVGFNDGATADRRHTNYVAPTDSGSAARYFYNAKETERDNEYIKYEVTSMENQEEQQKIHLYSEGKSYKLYQGSMLDMLDVIAPNSIEAIVTDPPYELGFMNKGWDQSGIAFQVATWEKCLQVLKPGGYLLAFGGSRTHHRITCAIEDAGFEIRDTIMWLYGCLSEDTEVLTENGFKLFNDIKSDEAIKIYDLDNRVFRYEVPEKWSSYRVANEICYSIKSSNTDQIVSKNHRCIVMEHGKYVVKFAENLDRTVIVPHIENDDNLNVSIATVTPIVYSGIIFCPTVSTGCFVARRNGQVFITGNSGFPKSMNIAKGIEAKEQYGKAGTSYKRKIEQSGDGEEYTVMQTNNGAMGELYEATRKEYTPTSEDAKKWDGWGTCLKPAYEAVVIARKPCEGSCIENVLQYGVGGINIDECRIGMGNGNTKPEYKPNNKNNVYGAGLGGGDWENTNGRFPANVILSYDEDTKDEVIGGMPITTSTGGSGISSKINTFANTYNGGWGHDKDCANLGGLGDTGSAARYFYTAKATTRDRDEGLAQFSMQKTGELQGGREDGSAGSLRVRADGSIGVNPFAGNGAPKRNIHPCCKPTDLMQYLVRLVTPKGGTILDPFNGSGSTGKAVMYENKDRNADYTYIGIELNSEYLAISDARIQYATKVNEVLSKPSETKQKIANNQMNLFDLPQ